jgi:two-component system LytT family response regulator
MLRALVVDDEPMCRRDLVERLTREIDFRVTGEAASGPDALRHLQSNPCDVVFLDVDMPGMDGLATVRALAPDHRPFIVFVTGHASFVLDAFEVNALDFLIKPIVPRRLEDTLTRLRAAVRSRAQTQLHEQLQTLLADAPPGGAADTGRGTAGAAGGMRFGRLTVRDGARFLFLDPTRIHWCTADANYVRCVVDGGSTYRIRGPLRQLSRMLPEHQFARIHRGTLVNVAHVKELRRREDGDFDAFMRDGTVLRMSHRFRHGIL